MTSVCASTCRCWPNRRIVSRMIHGVTDGGRATGDHHAGYYYNLTGHAPDITFKQQGNDRRPYPEDWPYMGSVVAMKRPQHPSLPSLITLPHKPSKLPFTRPVSSPDASAWSSIPFSQWQLR
jgi:hypothetical protein